MSNRFNFIFPSFLKDSFCTFKKVFLSKDYLFLVSSILMFLYFTMSIVFGRKPFNYVYNALLVGFCIITIIHCYHRSTSVLKDGFVLFWICASIYICITFIVTKSFSITPLANIAALLSSFIFFKSSSKTEKKYLALLIYCSLVILLIAACIRYIPKMPSSKNIVLLMNDGYFFNLDGLTDLLAICFGVSVYYFRKKYIFPVIFMVPSVFLCVVSMRRAAILIIIFSVLAYIYSLFKKGQKKYFLFVLLFFAIFSFILLLMPFMKSVSSRIIQTIMTFFGGAEETSMMNRLLMIMRGYFKGVVSPFSFYGFNNILKVASQTNHDTFGDMVFNFGGVLAIPVSCTIFVQIYKCFKANQENSLLLKISGLTLFVLFFITAIISNREMCFFVGIVAALNVDSYKADIKEKEEAKQEEYQTISI